ncbi:MAG: hypothetical protein V3U33_01375, partial [candidate division NC10 bacterium]
MTEPLKQVPRVRTVSPTRTQETVRVIYGVHSLEVNVAGRSVEEVRAALKQALNIGPQAVAVVDGREILDAGRPLGIFLQCAVDVHDLQRSN